MNKIVKKILVIVTGGFLISFITVISVLWVFSNNLPDYKFLKNYKAPVSSKVYSGDGELVNDFSSEKRIFVPYSAIPNRIINSFLSAEDKNFFHPGVDAKGVVRATINNISNILMSKRLEGLNNYSASCKEFLLSNEVSLNRKIKEAILALELKEFYQRKDFRVIFKPNIFGRRNLRSCCC